MPLRLARPDDAAAPAALSIEVWLGTYLRAGIAPEFADYVLDEFTAPRLKSLIGQPGQTVIVHENRDGVDGYVRVAQNRPQPEGGKAQTEIATLYVQPRHHGKGRGRALLDAACTLRRDQGVTALWVATNAENTPAIDFYRAYGFRPAGQTAFTLNGQSYPNDVFELEL